MRKLELPDEPEDLKKGKEDLLKTYEKSKTSVWRKDYILKELFNSCDGFCAYCGKSIFYNPLKHQDDDPYENMDSSNIEMVLFEKMESYLAGLGIEDSKMHVDHFIPKSSKEGENLVVAWGNLIPSCPACNIFKGKKQETIFNPYLDTFSLLFEIRSHGGLGNKLNRNDKDFLKAKNTEEIFKFDKKVNPLLRNKLISLSDEFRNIYVKLVDAIEIEKSDVMIEVNIERFYKLLKSGTRSRENNYYNIISCYILKEEYFHKCKKILKENNLYNNYFDVFEEELLLNSENF
jgi:5-methylcytosine-specific restriction endonuclease McrA